MNEFDIYKAWCKLLNLKPSNPDVLKHYLKEVEQCKQMQD